MEVEENTNISPTSDSETRAVALLQDRPQDRPNPGMAEHNSHYSVN